jgi:hypothetical protein
MLNNRNLFIFVFLFSCVCVSAERKAISEAPDERVNYPSNFQVEGGCNLFMWGEYLYWTAREDGLYFAQSGLEVSDSNASSFDGKLEKIDSKWDSGLRIAAGVNFPKEGYDAVLYWTWFSTDGNKRVHSEHKNLLPLWAQPDFQLLDGTGKFVDGGGNKPKVEVARGHWDLDMNVLDVEWGRSSWFGGHFSLRPFFGLRGAQIQQGLKVDYAYATSPLIFTRLHSNAAFRGGGLRAGANAGFAFCHGFAFYGLASGSLLYGQENGGLHVKENEFEIARTQDRFWKGVSSLQLSLGVGWDSHFSKDRLHVGFCMGWESNMWFSVNQMNHFMNPLSTGSFFKENSNLSTQGLFAGGRFDF